MSNLTIIDIPSPNYDSRPPGTIIDLVVVHAISLPPGKFGTGRVIDFFTNTLNPVTDPYFSKIAGLKVSSHYFIERQGRVIRFVADENRAWHAGVSHFQGRDNCNDFSLGIELEGDDFNPFSEIQYQRLNELLNFIKFRWPAVTGDRIVGHCHIAAQRKSDPGPFFDWGRVG
ncbi:MAG: 1,6-anhydro-N-acetylmuramyl-L-alanine amidase AmpD [Pseudomonadota bacterium]|nr:1,6-anhydro-N-acetylmuramyl-L-alanine amidase AmpD [Pseudomonadota bacterium]